MKTKLFTITEKEFTRLAKVNNYDYLGHELYQFYFYDIFNNLIAIHIYKVV